MLDGFHQILLREGGKNRIGGTAWSVLILNYMAPLLCPYKEITKKIIAVFFNVYLF